MAVYEEGFAPTVAGPKLTNLANYAGAALSLALILGVGFWGYKLIVRDVSGIPVVRAMEGDMRVLPASPGGSVAAHTGLSVNEVAASGSAGGPEDMLVLAPSTPGLAQEDLEVVPAVVDEVATETAPAAPVDEATEIEALAAQLAALAPAPLEPVAEPAATEATPAFDVIPASVPGVAISPRPMGRPVGLQTVAAPAPAPAADPVQPVEAAVAAPTFPAGTNLVQLGAFPSPTLAAQEWERLQARFGGLLANQTHFIEVSSQSGGTWYRLRASGFADRADARRLCSALQAEGANCIAVVTN